MTGPTVTLQPGPNIEMLGKHLDKDTARRITGPEYHYSVVYGANPDHPEIRDEYNILVNGQYVGEINLYHDRKTAHVGFWVAGAHRGQGVVREALRLLLTIYDGRYTFIRMTCWANNKPAMALLDRLGLKETRRVYYPLRHEEQFGEGTSHRRCRFDDLVATLNNSLKLQAA